MQKITLIWLWSFWLLLPSVISQSIENQFKQIGTAQGTSLSADPAGNLYLVDGHTLRKLSPDGTEVASYTNFQLGDIASIDVDNPLKIMVFYKTAGAIVFLDAQLAPISEILNLFDKNFYSISLATCASDYLIWLYDETKQELIAVDFYLNEQRRVSLDFDTLSPTELISTSERYMFLHDPSSGIFMFDAFGTYLKNIAILTPYPVQISGEQVFYCTQDALASYDFKLLAMKPLAKLPEKFLQAIIVGKNVLLLTDSKKICSLPLK